MTSASCVSVSGRWCVESSRVRRGGLVPSFRTAPVPSRRLKRNTPIVPRASVESTDEFDSDWVKTNEDQVRASPLVVGGVSVALLLLNRLLSGVAPVADASSAQSRADVLCLGMAGTLVLTGLQWLAVKQKPPTKVILDGVALPGKGWVDTTLPSNKTKELTWVWEALRTATACGSLIVVYKGKRVLQAGSVPRSMVGVTSREEGNKLSGDDALERITESVTLGPICHRCMSSGGGNYLANLILFPGRVEFESYLPKNAQAVVVSPIGNDGVLVAASGTQRGFTPADQAWMAVLAEKMDQTLSGEKRS